MVIRASILRIHREVPCSSPALPPLTRRRDSPELADEPARLTLAAGEPANGRTRTEFFPRLESLRGVAGLMVAAMVMRWRVAMAHSQCTAN
jgi:hypothetical protein